jgi:hypothetical protein
MPARREFEDEWNGKNDSSNGERARLAGCSKE